MNCAHVLIAAALLVSVVNLALVAVMLADVLLEHKDRRRSKRGR